MRLRKTQAENGQAMVEFALVAPLLFLILFGIIQFGVAFMHSVALTDAVRTGARTAAVSRTSLTPVSDTDNAVIKAAADLNSSTLAPRITVTTSSGWTAGGSVTVEAKYPYSINILGLVIASGDLDSKTTERIE